MVKKVKKVKCITDKWCCLDKGEIYEVIGVDKQLGMYGIIDASGDGYLYPPEDFEIVEEVEE